MNQLEVLADIASSGPPLSSSSSGELNDLSSAQQISAPTRPLSNEDSTNKEFPGTACDSSTETSLYGDLSATVTVRKTVDMEVGVLGTFLPTADPPDSLARETLAIPVSNSPVCDTQDTPHTPEVLVQDEFDTLHNLVPSSNSSVVTVGPLEVPTGPEDKPSPIVMEDPLSAPEQEPQFAPAPGLSTVLGEVAVPGEHTALSVSGNEGPLDEPKVSTLPTIDSSAWSALQTTERASTRLACKAASQSPTSSDSPQNRQVLEDTEMHPAKKSIILVKTSPSNDRPEGHSSERLLQSSGPKFRFQRPAAPATPERLHQPVNLASPKGAVPYVEIPYTVTVPTPVKRIPPPPEISTHGGPFTNSASAHSENHNTEDVLMEDPEASGRSRRKRTQNTLLRDYVPNSSTESESRSPSPPPPTSKKKRKQVDELAPAHSDSSTRPPKKRAKKVTATAAALLPSIQAQEASSEGEPGPSRSAPQAPPTGTRASTSKTSASTSLGPFIQKDRCIKFHPSIPRCHACISKKTGELCRYIDLRRFPGGTPQKPTGQPIWIDDPREPQQIFYPSSWNINPTLRHTKRVLQVVANALLPDLAIELGHTRLPEIIRRNRELECRASCDYCATSIFEAGWICKKCAREFCSDCRDKIVYIGDNRSSPQDVKERKKARSDTNSKREDNRLMYCQAGKAEHFSLDLRPVTRFRKDELETTIPDMGMILLEGRMNISWTEPDTNSSDQPKPIMRRDPSDPVDPSGVGTLPFYVFTAQSLTEEIFAPIWAKGQTVVVTGLLDAFQFQWTPDEFIRRYGPQTCHVVDCYDSTQAPTPMTVMEFFSQFGRYEGRTTCWKLKDWPPASLFSTEFPELFKDFAEAVPIPNYTRRDGVLNLAAHYPVNKEAVVPDIGPKMYNAFESSELSGGVGSTRLHMDMADAVNVMLHASPRQDGSPGCAVWDIYHAADSNKIRHFLNEKFGFSKTDPIHSQHYYLDSELRKELFGKEGVKSWRIYQKPGEAVFIPAGCAHQVCNLADCIKVAVDFVSPENIGRCEVLTAEFRQQNLSTVWKDDVLQLRHTLFHAWNSMKRLHPSLNKSSLSTASPTALSVQSN